MAFPLKVDKYEQNRTVDVGQVVQCLSILILALDLWNLVPGDSHVRLSYTRVNELKSHDC